MLKRLLFGCFAALVFAACEPEATPLPVDIAPTTPSAPTSEMLQPIRYGIDSNLLSMMLPEAVDGIAATGELESLSPPFLDSDLGSRYDILIALGDLPNATHAPTPLTISLALNTGQPPLDDNAITEIVRQALQTDAIVASLGIAGATALPYTSETTQTLRTSLANAGLPDGFDLSLASFYASGAEVIAQQLRVIGIQTRINTMTTDQAGDLAAYHLTLFGSGAQSMVANLGGTETIDLFTLPVSYRALPELTIEFTSGGIPLARR